MRRALVAVALVVACMPELRSFDAPPEPPTDWASSPRATTYRYIPGMAYCTNAWVEIERDNANCGGCGQVCRANGSTCILGECRCPGLRGYECDGRCVDLASDSGNCGTCGRACVGGARCVDGVCEG